LFPIIWNFDLPQEKHALNIVARCLVVHL